MRLKEFPEDFVVEEISDRSWLPKGPFLVLRVTKRLRNSEEVAAALASFAGVPRRFVNYAGNKDFRALTTQFFSVRGAVPDRFSSFSMGGVALSPVGFTDEPLSLGSLRGNHFTIAARGLTAPLHRKVLVPNFFGKQRFGADNVAVGRAILKRDFRGACDTIISVGGRQASVLQTHLAKSPNDVVGALRRLPKKVLSLYVHAFQSFLFNELLRRKVAERGLLSLAEESLPLIGFATELDGDVRSLLEAEGLGVRDFVVREFPECSSEGAIRPAAIRLDNLVIGELELDGEELRCVVSFTLPKGSYATVVMESLEAE